MSNNGRSKIWGAFFRWLGIAPVQGSEPRQAVTGAVVNSTTSTAPAPQVIEPQAEGLFKHAAPIEFPWVEAYGDDIHAMERELRQQFPKQSLAPQPPLFPAHVLKSGDPVLVFDSCTLRNLAISKKPRDTTPFGMLQPQDTHLELVKKIMQEGQVVVVPSYVADNELCLRTMQYNHANSKSLKLHPRTGCMLVSQQHSQRWRSSSIGQRNHGRYLLFQKFFADASRLIIKNNGETHFIAGKNPRLIITESECDRELNTRRGATPDGGDESITHLIRHVLPYHRVTVVSDDACYLSRDIMQHATPLGRPLGFTGTQGFLEAAHALEIAPGTREFVEDIYQKIRAGGGHPFAGMDSGLRHATVVKAQEPSFHGAFTAHDEGVLALGQTDIRPYPLRPFTIDARPAPRGLQALHICKGNDSIAGPVDCLPAARAFGDYLLSARINSDMLVEKLAARMCKHADMPHLFTQEDIFSACTLKAAPPDYFRCAMLAKALRGNDYPAVLKTLLTAANFGKSLHRLIGSVPRGKFAQACNAAAAELQQVAKVEQERMEQTPLTRDDITRIATGTKVPGEGQIIGLADACAACGHAMPVETFLLLLETARAHQSPSHAQAVAERRGVEQGLVKGSVGLF